MKFKIVVITLLISSLGFSQDLYPVPVTESMSKGIQSGIEVFIPNVSDDELEDAIKDITKPYKGKIVKIKRSDETIVDNVLIKEISPNTIDIHQLIQEADNGYKYTAFFNLGGVFLDNNYNPEKFAYATDVVKRIAMRASELHMNDLLKDENKALDKLEDDKKDLLKENDRAARDIQKAKDLIAKQENTIQDNLKMMETKAVEIEKQRQKVMGLQNEKAYFVK